eukprot:gnl/TRDRNA2_/TRDRNA2_164681_c0_seq1.p1 gnl/TRDRNA2_/TRDRNA2_164681_c0~~gnl/TRDRNA2_/TRDRNA2_164681_c0_seq1.p1  ORF type:complete len:239 (+),score=43.50 gnl/TRDRNA2_/TRDRNA2_164681_c0_seq1:179-895(+)
MLLSPDFAVPSGPPPQAVLDQRWLWQVLKGLLCVTFVLRMVGLDIAGGLLTGLMLCFAIIMTRDGMSEMARYALVYAVLCGLNFFFDILPLLTELGGRVTKETEPVRSIEHKGIEQTTYTLTVKTTPFFDRTQGIVYNMQSTAMIVSPVCMMIGVYLAVTAHNEFQRTVQMPFADEEVNELRQRGLIGAAQAAQQPNPNIRPPTNSEALHDPTRRPAINPRTGEPFERFAGQGHKLGD